MFASPAAFLALALLAPEPRVDTKLVQVAPATQSAVPRRSPGVARAVVLLHGLRPHPWSDSNVRAADFSLWEEPDSTLVKALAPDSDVYALGYAQHMAVDDVARTPALRQYVADLRAANYTDVVLVGYSAGALVARYFVENTGGGGVTKVIQVCPPNGGSGWSRLAGGVRKSQEAFVRSLSKESRQTAMRARAGVTVPAGVEFVCVLGSWVRGGDGLVRDDCQWPADLQEQGVPAVAVSAGHLTAMRSKAVAQKVAELVREPQPRWTAAEVETARARLLRGK